MDKRDKYHSKVRASLEASLGTKLSARQVKALAKLRHDPERLKEVWEQARAAGDTAPANLRRLLVGTLVGTPGQGEVGTPVGTPCAIPEGGTTSDAQKLTMVRHAVRVLSNLENVERWASGQPPETMKEVRGLLKLVAEHVDNYLLLWDAYNRLGRKVSLPVQEADS